MNIQTIEGDDGRLYLSDGGGVWRFPDRYQAAQMADLVGGQMVVLGNVQYPFAVVPAVQPDAGGP